MEVDSLAALVRAFLLAKDDRLSSVRSRSGGHGAIGSSSGDWRASRPRAASPVHVAG
jgi:hypothetical protein